MVFPRRERGLVASALIARCLRRKRWGFLVLAAVLLVALGSTRSVLPQSDQPQPDQPQSTPAPQPAPTTTLSQPSLNPDQPPVNPPQPESPPESPQPESPQPESPCESETVVPQDQEELKADCEALWEFYINLDERGILDDPDLSDAWGWNTALNDWHGVAVVNNRVEYLFLLTHMGLSGSISESIQILSQLDNLRWLEIEGFGSSGPIPPEIGEFPNLQGLSLQANNLSGSIPPEVGQLTNLITLNFGYNNLTGLIPPELARLNNLESLLLHENHLEISIPPELSQLTNLRELHLSKIN